MKHQRHFLLAGICLSVVLLSATASADITNLRLSGDIKAQSISVDDTDLGTANRNWENSQSLQSRLRLTGNFTDRISFLTEGRGVLNFGDGSGEDPVTGETLSPDDFLELREAWIQSAAPFGYLPVSLRAGRQRFVEAYGFWWNRNFDAARVIYDTTLFKGFLATGQNLSSYRTSGDDFNEDDENMFRLLGEASWQWKYHHFFETRFVYQDDHSGGQGIGTVVRSNDRDDNDANLFWSGVRFAGLLPFSFKGAKDNLARSGYRIDLVGLAGQEDAQTTAAGAPGFRIVTGRRDRDVKAWALDAGASLALPLAPDPVLTLGYAFGSGDDDTADNTNNNFRQTGLDGNFSYPAASTTGVHNYGTVLRPDLSNLHILTAGIGAPVLKASNLSLIYHYYRRVHEQSNLDSSGVASPLGTASNDIGHGADLVFNIDVGKEFNIILPKVANQVTDVNFRTTLGAFQAGEAYGAASGNIAMRGLAELRFRF